MKVKRFPIEQLGAELYMGVGTFIDIQKFSQLVLDTELSKDEYGTCRGVCIDNQKRSVICCILTENTDKNDYSRVLLHEVFHGIHYIFDYLGVDLSYNNTETLAYYIDYYYNELLTFLQEINDGERKARARKGKKPDNARNKKRATKK